MDARDRFEALEWALNKLGQTSDPVACLYLQYLRQLRDEAKREAGR